MRRLSRGRAGAVAVAAVLAGTAWLLWPAGLGGRSSYVTTHGISMEPGFHTGDLAIIRPAATYATGDVVAYRSTQLDTVVMHRIVDVHDGRYTFKGDNNSWLDPERPGRDQLVGRLALRVPRGGVWLRRASGTPGRAGLAFALLAAGGGAVQVGRRRRSMGRHRRRGAGSAPALSTLPPALRTATAATAAAGVAGLALGAMTWTGPLVTETAGTRPVSRSVTFSYATTVPRTAAYDSTTVTAPDPVFRKVAQRVAVTYVYQGGAARLSVAAELSAPSGWHSTVPLAAERAVVAGRTDGVVRLDLPALAARASAAAKVTGVPIEQVSVDVVPRVTAAGGATFAPALRLVLTPLRLELAEDQKNLTITDAATVSTPVRTARTVTVLGRSVGAEAGRRWSVRLLAGALLAALVTFLLARRSAPSTETARISRRYAPLLLPVLPPALPADRPVVDVAEFGTLVKLAERYGLLVLHWSRGDVTTYVVRDESATYRYSSA
jgi:signal peptidase I